MEATITFGQLFQFAALVGGLWAAYKVICEILEAITAKHDRMQKWDEYDKQIRSIEKEQCLLTYCMMATLDGLHQLGANGPVTEAKEKLEKHINKKAHNEEEI